MHPLPRFVAALLIVSAACRGAHSGPSPAASTYEVYAIRYATLNYPVSSLVVGADRSRRLDIAMMVWLLRGPNGRNVLVDAGFHRENFVNRWHTNGLMPTSEAGAGAADR